jgi:hypothetical protein
MVLVVFGSVKVIYLMCNHRPTPEFICNGLQVTFEKFNARHSWIDLYLIDNCHFIICHIKWTAINH